MDKKRALITGASGDIGAAIATQLARSGHEVILHANSNRQAIDRLAEALAQAGCHAQCAQFDLCDAVATQHHAGQLLENGSIQTIINNAGVHDDAVMAGMTQQQWKKPIEVSLDGFFNITQPLLLPMIRTRWGRIVNIASIAGIIGNRGQTNYAAAKAGLIGASKSLALELASRNITVNVVALGIIQGSMTQAVFPEDKIKQLVPMQRAGEPADVAYLVDFLCSEKAAYITSQVFSVDGGMA